MPDVTDIAELRRRCLAGEDLTADEYRLIIAARRNARRALGATKTAASAATKVSATEALASLDDLLGGAP